MLIVSGVSSRLVPCMIEREQDGRKTAGGLLDIHGNGIGDLLGVARGSHHQAEGVPAGL